MLSIYLSDARRCWPLLDRLVNRLAGGLGDVDLRLYRRAVGDGVVLLESLKKCVIDFEEKKERHNIKIIVYIKCPGSLVNIHTVSTEHTIRIGQNLLAIEYKKIDLYYSLGLVLVNLSFFVLDIFSDFVGLS